MTFLKKKWPMILLAILLLLPMAVCLSDMKVPEDVLFVPEIGAAEPLGEFRDDSLIEQVFVAPSGEIPAVEVQIGTYMRENNLTIRVDLRELDGERTIATREIDASRLVDNAYEQIDFDSVQVRQGERYVLALRSEGADAGNTVALYRGEEGSATEEVYARVNGEDQSYALAFRIVGASSRLYGFVIALLLAFFVVLAGVIWALSKNLPRETVFSILALGLGLLYMFAIPPLSIPDGTYHYYTSYQMSSALMGQKVNGVYYGEADDFDFSDFSELTNNAGSYLRIIDEFGQGDGMEDKTLLPLSYDRYDKYFIQELPSGLGITVSRLLGRNFVTTILMGRLFNLLFFVACVYFSVKRIPQRFKTPMGLATLVPMALQQAASCSYDCFINGVSLFLVASILKAIYDEGTLSKRDYLCILVAGMLLAPAKMIYSVILLLCFLIPWERFGSKKKKIIGIGLIFLCIVVFILIFQLASIGNIVDGGDGLNWAGGHNYTIGFILSHPLRTVKIFIRTLIERGGWYVDTMIGSSLCGLSLPVPSWIIKGFILVLCLAAFNQEEALLSLHRGSFILVSAMVVGLAMLSMFLVWTSDTWPVIEGVQGRYLLPTCPLMVFSLCDSLTTKRKVDRELILAFVLLHGNTLMAILQYTLEH